MRPVSKEEDMMNDQCNGGGLYMERRWVEIFERVELELNAIINYTMRYFLLIRGPHSRKFLRDRTEGVRFF